MAGSYSHATLVDGKLLRPEDFAQLIEFPKDAYEMAQEMYGMIWWLADALSGETVLEAPDWVERARADYKTGLAISPGTDGSLKGHT